MNEQPGWRTSEFWVVILKLLAGVVMVFIHDTREIGLLILGASGQDGSGYVRSRAEIKKARL